MNIKRIVLHLFKKIFLNHTSSSANFVSYLKANKVEVGCGTYFFDPLNTKIDLSRPYLIEIGRYCKITSGVRFLSHDYSYSVLRYKYSELFNSLKRITIGDNVFIGVDSIILPGTVIGNNCIVGAGAIVSGCFPENKVIVGNPARVLCSIEDFYKKRGSKMLEEAFEYYKILKHKRINLKQSYFASFYFLFEDSDYDSLCEKNMI